MENSEWYKESKMHSPLIPIIQNIILLKMSLPSFNFIRFFSCEIHVITNVIYIYNTKSKDKQ